MAPANPPVRELDGGSSAGAGSGGSGSGGVSSGKAGGKGSSTVPGRIGRPPQWTSTRSRKLVRLYMYSTLSVDKILKVLEDDVFKPRKNSAQKTIHNMLDHDPRYLRPESREDMNQRVKLLAGSTQRKRRSWKKHGENQQQQQQQQQQQHQQHPHPHSQYQQPPLPPPMGHSGYEDGILHGIKPEMGHGSSLSHLPQHSQHQHAQHHQHHSQHTQHPQHSQYPAQSHQQHLQHPHHVQQQHHQQQHSQHQLPPQPHHLSQQYPSQTSPTYLPPPQNLQQQQHHQQQQQQHQQQQPYNDFYHPQYQQQAPPPPPPQQQHQQYPLSMQQMTAHNVPPFMGGGWGGVYDNQPHAADPASRLTMNSSFDMAQHQTGMAPLHAQQQQQQHHQQHPQHAHQHQQQHPHATHGHPHHHYHQNEHGGIDGHGNLGTLSGGITSSHLPLFGEHQRQRRMSSAAYSTDSDASSDVSTETIQDLKNRLSGCSTHYANQIANLLRRFTISNGSDDPSSPSASVVLSGPRGSNDNSADPHRIRKLWRQKTQRIRSSSVSSNSSSGSFDVFDSDVDVYGEAGEDDDTTRRGQSSHGGSNPASVSGGASPDGRDDEHGHGRGGGHRRHGGSRTGASKTTTSTTANATTILGASGDNAGNPRLVLPGDFFNAYQYRDDANCPFHSKEAILREEQEKRQRQAAEEQQNDRRGGRGGANSANAKTPREKRCWCAIAEAVGAVAAEDGSFWVLADGRLTPDAQAMVHEPTQQRHQLARRDRFGHSMLHLFASREGLQMQLLAMVLNCDDATLLAANTAGQTFLHVLAPGWFVGLHEPYSPLVQLLAHLRSRTRQPPAGGSGTDAADDAGRPGSGDAIAHLIYATDVYGRSFFHRFGTFVNDPNIITNTIIQHYDRAALSRRDAFAHAPLAIMGAGASVNSGGPDEYGNWQQQSSSPTKMHHMQRQSIPSLQFPGQTLSPHYDDDGQSQNQTLVGGSPSPTAPPALGGGNVPTVFSSEDAFIRHHESLLRTVTASDNNPSVEDPEGRNGLHCLAEAIVDKRIMDDHRNALSAGRKPPKKKTLDKKDPNAVSTTSSSSFMNGLLPGGESGSVNDGMSGGPTYSSTSPYMNNPALGGTQSLLHTSSDGAQMATRLRLVQGLLSPPIVVDVNHYDRRGQTVLTAFVVHIADDQEDKAKSLVAILETLLSAGARIEGRNRRGETALLVAARLGRKIALTTLLDHGADVHARDAAGRGVLDVLDMQCRRQGRNNVALYGRLEACRVLLTSIKQLPLGVKQRPTLMDEWTIVHRRGPEPRDITMAM